MSNEVSQLDPEISAINDVYSALSKLDSEGQERVIQWVTRRLNLATKPVASNFPYSYPTETGSEQSVTKTEEVADQSGGELDGVSSVAKKWLQRNGLVPSSIDPIFSLGLEEIAVVAKAIPGKGKKERLRNVFLLSGVAAYLGSGAARYTHETLKETAVHYDAWDSSNFAANLKDFVSEIAGSKESGYTLTSRGLTSAAELLKEMTRL